MTTESSGKNIGLLYGLIYAAVNILFTLMLYLGGVSWFMSPLTYFGLLIPILFATLSALQLKKLQGGYIEFSEALKTTFQVLVTGALIATLFEYILFNYIDVPFRQALMQASARKMEEYLQGKMSQEKLDKMVEDMQDANNYSVGKLLLSFAVRCIGLFIVSLIVSAIVKKKRPPFENSFNQ